MAEIVVSAAVTVLIEKLLAGDLMKFAPSKGIESTLKKWEKNLPMIQAVLADASEKHITQEAIKLMYGRKIRPMLDEITEKLNDLVEQKNNLGIGINTIAELRSNRNNKRLEQTSLLDVSTVLGREADQEALLSKLLGEEACNQNGSVMSIVGLGGIGKTTLAQLLYNNEKVKGQFELRVWICVSDEFDVLTISNKCWCVETFKQQENSFR
ncbi:putative disease resistance RPP13-like protein 1 [Rutidosis leptorrhynchoides]|uniref:putative disease resistance RPP13-like protein 1 n=1 Tax=Rutidosis leptorrhynchoides TaxID=125765 RepID=UPI003A9995A3